MANNTQKLDWDPLNAASIILTYPDGCCRPEMVDWLEWVGIKKNRRFYLNKGDYDCTTAYNTMAHDALRLPYKWFIFGEKDIKPDYKHTLPFLNARGPVVGAIYDVDNEAAFDYPRAIHTGLMRCSREALESIEPPWFQLTRSDDGQQLLACPCKYFQEKLNAAGIETIHAGHVYHKPKHRHI